MGHALGWIKSYLTNRSQFVRVGAEQSAEVSCEFGVPHAGFGPRTSSFHSTMHRLQTSSRHMGSVILSMPMTHNCTSHWTKTNPLKYCKIVLMPFTVGSPRTDCRLIRKSRKQSFSERCEVEMRGPDPIRVVRSVGIRTIAWSRCDD